MKPHDQPLSGPLDVVPASGSAPQSPRVGIFQAFGFANYRYLWLGSLFTSIAIWVQQTTVGWVVYDLTGSGTILGSVTSMRAVPALLIAPLAGIAADRMRKQHVVTISQIIMFTSSALMGLGLLFHVLEVWHLFLFTFVMGAAQSFNMPARQTMVFDVVPRHVITNAVALSNLANSFSRTFGPMAGGALITLFGPSNNFFLQASAYLGVTAMIFLMHLPPRQESTEPRRSMLKDAAAGYKYAITQPQTRLLMFLSMISPIFLIPIYFSIMPVFAKVSFHVHASGLGILLATVGVGGFCGGLLTAALGNVDRRGMLQLIALLVFSLAVIGFAAVAGLTGNMYLALPFLFIAGMGESLFNTTNQTVLQLTAPDDMRGRLTSVMQLGPLLWPIGGLVAGTASDHINVAWVGVIMGGTALVIGVGLFFFSPRMRQLRMSDLERQHLATDHDHHIS